MWYYEVVTNNNVNELSPIDKIKIHQYEVERQKEIIKSLKEKLTVAEKSLSDKIEETNNMKKEAKDYLKGLMKEL